PFSAFGSACATYCSQNLGAGRPERVGKGIKSAIIMCWIWSLVAVAVGYLFAPAIISWIAGTEEVFIVELASRYMRVNTPFYFILAVLIVMRSSLQGLGRKTVPVASSVIEMIGKAVVAFAAAPVLGYFGVMISEPVVWFFMTVLLVWGYARDRELVKATFVKEKKAS
ncbi:MAG: MATE family efflux transporter, partial [Huintestinicola sp.]